MLSTIGEQPVNTVNTTGVLEVEQAKQALKDALEDVQTQEWHFNTEKNVRLLPDENAYIQLPAHCLQAWPCFPQYQKYIVKRGNRLYNKRDATYKFDHAVAVNMIYKLSFDELKPVAQRYVAAVAGRLFQERVTGSTVTEEFARVIEYTAKAELEASDARDANYNLLHDNLPNARTVRRDRY